MIGLEKSFWMIYSNTHLRTRETLPLKDKQSFIDWIVEKLSLYFGIIWKSDSAKYVSADQEG